MRSGTPVAMSGRRAMPELVGDQGAHVDRNDSVSVAPGIVELLGLTDEMRAVPGMASRQ